MRRLDGHKHDVRAVAFTPDGRLVSGGSDKTVRVWAPMSGKCLHTFKAMNVVYALALTPEGKVAATAGRYPAWASSPYNLIQFWDLEKPQRPGDAFWHMQLTPRSIWSVAYSAAGEYLAAACRLPGGGNIPDGGGGHWWRRHEPTSDADFADPRIYALAFAPTGTAVAVTHEHAVTVFDRPGGNQLSTHHIMGAWSPAVVFLPDDTLAVASNSYIYLLDAHRSSPTHVLPNHIRSSVRAVTALALSPDGKLLLAGGKPTVECYDLGTRTRRAAFDFEVGTVHALAFAPDGCTFAVAGQNGLLVCDVE